jgi:hypothetical protein
MTLSPTIIEFDAVRPWDDDAKWRSVWNSDVSTTRLIQIVDLLDKL